MAWATMGATCSVMSLAMEAMEHERSWAMAKEVILPGMMCLRLRMTVLQAGRAAEAGAPGRAGLPSEALVGAEAEVGVEFGTVGGTRLLAEVRVVVVAEGAQGF